MTKKPIDQLVIIGPTATGKTILAANMAIKLNGEIISADSRQIYRGMDLGTGKDLADYTVNGISVPHHLIDIIDAGEKYNVFQCQSDFLKAYTAIREKGKLPILCGGSGMYIEAVLKGYKLIDVPNNEPLRTELEQLDLPELTAKLAKMKPLHNKTDVDTKDRAIRAIEIATYYASQPTTDLDFPAINSLIIGIELDRQTVKNRITERLKQRLRQGMIDEVQALLNKGVPAEVLVYYGLEYKFITPYLAKEFSYNTMVSTLNVAIHQFAKRQMTWFRKMEREGFNIHWLDGNAAMEEKIKEVMELIQNARRF
ncbi:MAG: tRNA (adenosine(37)-N6)-dimethylallyltransferase MiaA [Salinivirgaceae bacterium]